MNHYALKRPSKSLTAPTEKRICLRWAVVVFAAVASLLMAVACAPAKKSVKDNGSATFVTTLPTADAEKAYSTSVLTCETKNGICPEAVGLLVSKFPNTNETDVFQCTSFLVANDIVATNSHCIPTDLRASNSQCAGRIQVIFGKTEETPLAKYECDKVLSSSEIVEDKANPEYGHKPDYAFIKLKQSVLKRKPLKFSRLGLQEGLQLNVLAIDPDQNSKLVRGTLRLKKCAATQNSVTAQGFTHDFAPVAAAAGCQTIQGNSGSPMLDASGKVRGILYGHNTSVDFTGGVEVPEKFDDSTLLSNVACLAVPDRVILPGAINPACATESSGNVFQDVLTKTPLKADSLFEEWAKTAAPKMFQFELKKTDTAGALNYGFPAPTCLQPLDRWGNKPDKSADGSITIVFEVPVWSQTQAVNSKFQATVSTKATSTVKYQTKIDMEALSKGEPTYIELSAQNPSATIRQSLKGHFAICP